MTIIEEEFTDIALVGDDVTVSFHGRPIRPTSTVTGLVTPKRVPVRAVDGKITSPELDPGPCEVLIETGRWKREYSIVVPSEGTHRLRDLIETYETPAPPVVSLVKKFRDDTIEARDIAVAAAEGVAGITDDLEKIAEDRAAPRGHATKRRNPKSRRVNPAPRAVSLRRQRGIPRRVRASPKSRLPATRAVPQTVLPLLRCPRKRPAGTRKIRRLPPSLPHRLPPALKMSLPTRPR